MRWLVIVAVLAIVGTAAAGIYEPQIKRFFGDCPHGEVVVHGRYQPGPADAGDHNAPPRTSGIIYSSRQRSSC